MKSCEIGRGTGLEASRLVYGIMRIVGRSGDAEAIECLHVAFDAGYTHFDTANIYGRGRCSELLGKAMKQRPNMRDRIVITTKCGIRRLDPRPETGSSEWYDHSSDHIVSSAETELRRMDIETIDILLLHRPDILVETDEVAQAFEALHKAGKVRFFGVSNYLPDQVRLLQEGIPFPIVMNQVRISPLDVACFYDGTLEQCRLLGITPQAWSPVAGGTLGTGASPPSDDPRREDVQRVIEVFDAEADSLGCTRTQLVLAWLMRHPSGILPVIGTSNLDRIVESAGSDDIELSRESWHRLTNIARWYCR
jgi:predicted oxidoreductase